jgi:RNA polymerase sigma-70 factor (ECF subfamily)
MVRCLGEIKANAASVKASARNSAIRTRATNSGARALKHPGEPATLGGTVGEATDEELMARVRSGDLQSFGVLAARYNGPLFSFASRYLGRREEAEEVRQEALLRALDQARTFDPAGRFRAWIYRIALNLCHDRSRRRRRWRFLPFASEDAGAGAVPEAAAEEGGAGEEWIDRRDSARRLRRALTALPAEQRAVLVLKEFQELTFKEIAELLECPESTVKSRLYRGLCALRATLDAGGEPAEGR